MDHYITIKKNSQQEYMIAWKDNTMLSGKTAQMVHWCIHSMFWKQNKTKNTRIGKNMAMKHPLFSCFCFSAFSYFATMNMYYF